MSYKDYIKTCLQTFTNKYIINVVDEVDFNYNPQDNEILVVIKTLSGSVVGNVKFMPIQFNVFSASGEVNDTKAILTKFVETYSNTHTMLGLDYYKQDYNTPIDMNNFMQVGATERAEFLITGTLMVAGNISDVQQVYINNTPINYLNLSFTYSTTPNPAKTPNDNLQSIYIANANLQMTITAYANIDLLNTLISLHKKGVKSPNDIYNIKLEYTDSREEEYKCRITSFNDSYDITNAPTRSVVFFVCH